MPGLDSRNESDLAVYDSTGCDTASVVRGLGLATERLGIPRLICDVAMVHFTALQAIRITVAPAGKRIGNEQTNAENQYQQYAQGFIQKHFMYA
jgi:hypothetical protein